MHSTNYYNTFIQVADDCLVTEGEAPPQRAEKSVANVHYDLLGGNPYRYTSDEVIFEAHRERNRISDDAVAAERERFFAKGQACLRSSPLAKRYGWGSDSALKHLKAMRSKRQQAAR